jgi:hypothetical protein
MPIGMTKGSPYTDSNAGPGTQAAIARKCLILPAEDGDWTIDFSPGIEKFIGVYPRLPDFDPVIAGFLKFHDVRPARA